MENPFKEIKEQLDQIQTKQDHLETLIKSGSNKAVKLRLAEASAEYGIPLNTLRDYRQRGVITVEKIGRPVYLVRETFEKELKELGRDWSQVHD